MPAMGIRMDKPTAIGADDGFLVLSDLPPSQTERRLAVVFSFGIVAVFFVIVGLSDNRPHPIPGFVLAFSTAMFVCDTITAILLFAQFSILRSPALLVIANGYVFTALILIPYTLTFPGVIGSESLIGGLQSPAGLYVVWHSGFPAFVIGYALSKDADPRKRSLRAIGPDTAHAAIALSVALTAVLVAAAATVCIAGEPLLPRIMLDKLSFSSLYPYVVGGPDVSLSVFALIVLWIRRRSALDLWLMVVMFLYAIDMPLSYYPAPIRFSDGWYAVRAIAFLASSIVLIVLLYEITTLYARLFRAIHAQRRERGARLITGDAVAATIAHEIKQPLSAMITRAETGLRWLDRSTPELDKAKEQFAEIAADGRRAGAVMEGIRANFKKDAQIRTWLDVNVLIEETLNLVHGDLQQHRILVRTEHHAELPQIMGDRIQLQQVFLNLIANAIEAMAGKEELRILGVRSELSKDGGIAVSIADTGRGIKPQEIDQIFNPLFTTKPDGMGMGLSICRSIVESHEGNLLVFPNSPRGTVFQMILHANMTTSPAPT
jgi:signal transduction histidine kinase